MRYKLGRLLQFLGLFVIMPLALAGQVMEHLTVGQMFLCAGAGIIVFLIGKMLQPSGEG